MSPKNHSNKQLPVDLDVVFFFKKKSYYRHSLILDLNEKRVEVAHKCSVFLRGACLLFRICE